MVCIRQMEELTTGLFQQKAIVALFLNKRYLKENITFNDIYKMNIYVKKFLMGLLVI